MTSETPPSLLIRAFEFAAGCHAGQKRKASQAPFLHHPMATASLVLQYGGTETQAAAALLHDTIGNGVGAGELERRFGREVTELVMAFADPEGVSPGAGWLEARRAYLTKVAALPEPNLLLAACEELHEGRELVHDLRSYGLRIEDRFPAAPGEVLACFETLLGALEKRPPSRALLREFRAMIEELRELV